MNKIKGFKAFLESNADTNIISLLKKSFDSGWYGSNLENSFECVRCDNAWDVKLIEQYGEDVTVKQILIKIEECSVDLWEDDLSDTFSCVVLEDIFDEDGILALAYNGWYEDILKYFSEM